MGKSSAPPPPDYRGAATETAAGNIDAARLASRANRVDQFTPYGSQTYTDLGGDRWQQNNTLTAAGQQLLDQQNKTSQGLAGLQDGATARVGNTTNSALPSAYSANGQMPGVYDPNQSTNNATQLIMNRQQPMLDHDQAALNTQLVNQGLQPGTEAYNRSMDQFTRQKNDAYSQASLQGISLGQGQQAQTYAQQHGNSQLDQSQQQQEYEQQIANRNIPMNELNAIRTGSQVTNPTFSQVPMQATTAGPDYLGAANSGYNAALGSTNASNAASGNFTSGLMGLAGAAIGGPAGGMAGGALGRQLSGGASMFG